MTEVEILEGRYRRLIRFDQVLCAFYSATALVPISVFAATGSKPIFHATGAVSIMTVGMLGWMVDSKLLATSLRSEVSAYGITAFFVVSRIALALWGVVIVSSTWPDADRLKLTLGPFLGAMLDISTAPPVAALLLLAVFYRVLYHISVHFLLKIQRIRRVGPGALPRAES